MNISESDLNTYEVFVFNTDQKTEKFHYKTMRHKEMALQKARTLQDTKIFEDISDQSVYNS